MPRLLALRVMIQIARIVVINVLITLALLAGLEVGSRLIHPVGRKAPLISDKRQPQWTANHQFDPYLFWSLRPNTLLTGEERTNSNGLRGPEISPKADGEFRILSLGESTTFGDKVDYQECYSSLLSNELGPVNGKPVLVINGGVPGYSMFQGLTYLQRHGLALRLDAVIVYFGYNDFLKIAYRARRDDGSVPGAGGMTDRELYQQRITRRSRVAFWLMEHSNFARLFLLRPAAPDEDIVLDRKAVRVPEADRRWILSEFRALSLQHGFRLVVVIPWYLSFQEHIPLLRELESWSDITVVDLPAAFADLPDPRASYFYDKVHPNSKGHELIVGKIARDLSNSWNLREP